MIKKIISLSICIVMLLSFANAINASAAMTDEVTIYQNDCYIPGYSAVQVKDPTEYADFTNNGQKIYSTPDTSAGCLGYRITSTNQNAKYATLANMTGNIPTFVKGGTYKLTLRAKVNLVPNADTKTFGVYPSVNFGTNKVVISGSASQYDHVGSILYIDKADTWTEFTYEFTIEKFADESITECQAPIALRYMSVSVLTGTGGTAASNNHKVFIDDITITQTGVPEVAVAVGENGTVKYGETELADSDSFFKAQGSTVTLDVTPAEGYVAKATVNGAEYVINNNQINVTVNDDTDIAVTFEEAPVEKAIVDNKTVAEFRADNSLYVYSLISEYNSGDASYYGIYIGGEGITNGTLYAMKDNAGNKAVSKPGQAFIIKVINADPAKSYTVQPFIGDASGEARTLTKSN